MKSEKSTRSGCDRVWIVFLLGLLLTYTTAADAIAPGNAADTTRSPFPIPAGLEGASAFWTRIYAELDSGAGLIHDNRRLDLVYQTLYLNPDAPPAAQESAIQGALEGYRAALLTLASGKRSGLSALEQQALGPWGENASSAELASAAERLRFQRGQSDRFRRGLARSRRWATRIKAILKAHGLPPQLSALPHVESSYNPLARSKAGAAGLWQFMPVTARRYLRVDATLDERLDPYRSTEAAALLLKQNYSVLKSWPLAITAYNHGLSGVRRAQRELETDDLGKIVEQYQGERFGFASRNFYVAFSAVAALAANPGRYFGRDRNGASDSISLVTPAYLPVEVILAAFSIGKDQLRELNPSLHHAVWNGAHFVPKDHPVRLPGDFTRHEAEEVLRQLGEHFGFSSQRPYGYYEVRLGDSTSTIAERHDTTVANLVSMNELSSPDDIGAGQTLRVPVGPIPEPLGAGAAAMLRNRLETGDLFEGASMVTDRTHVLAVAAGFGYPRTEDGGKSGTLGPALNLCADEGFDPEKPGQIPASANGMQQDLTADPADYAVAADDSIEIQVAETMGHYADWLDTTSGTLRRRNRMKEKEPLIVGRRLRMDFSHVSRKRFGQRRIAFHQLRQMRYFQRYRISGVLEHRIRSGDNLWLLAEQQYRIPMWLLRQYNPDIDVDTVLALDGSLYIPLVETRSRRPNCVAGADVDDRQREAEESIARTD